MSNVEDPVAVATRLTDSPLQFELSIEVDCRCETVFRVLTDFKGLARWMPFVRRVDVETDGHTGQVTRVIYPSIGPPTREKIVAVQSPNYVAYSATDETLHGMYVQHLGLVVCQELADHRARVRWFTYAKRGRGRLMRTVGPVVVRCFVRRSLRNLKRLLDHHSVNASEVGTTSAR